VISLRLMNFSFLLFTHLLLPRCTIVSSPCFKMSVLREARSGGDFFFSFFVVADKIRSRVLIVTCSVAFLFLDTGKS